MKTGLTDAARLLVLVLVESRPRRATEEQTHVWGAQARPATAAAAPSAREVPRLDLVKGPFLRIWAFFVATTTSSFGRAVGRERH